MEKMDLVGRKGQQQEGKDELYCVEVFYECTYCAKHNKDVNEKISEMDANCAKDGLRYYKEQINYQPSLPCTDVYPEAYGIKGDAKDRRVYPTGPLYYQSNYKPDVNFRDKATQPKTAFVDYGPSSFKDSSYAYPYYDQYKYNVAPINNVPQLPKTVNYQSYQTNPIMNTSMNSAFYEENNVRAKVPNMNYHQYNYTNFYGYSAPTQPSPNFCGYGYTEESRLLWEDYQNNRTYPPPYVHANPPIKEPINHITYPPVLRSREKPVCTANSPRLHSSSNHCNNGVSWPTHFPYQPVTQNFRSPCNKLYCHEDQNPNYCVVRHDKSELYQNYKYLQNQHISPYRPPASDMCVAPAPIYFENKVETPFHNGLAGYPDQNGVVYHKPVTSETQKRSYNYSQAVNSVGVDPNFNQFQVFDEGVSVQTTFAQDTNAYDTTGQGDVMTKQQNLREFLSSWNEDEDDGSEKLGVNLESCPFLDENVLEQNNGDEKDVGSVESNLQFNTQFGKVRPKIHVGITVDSNIPNDQYINLPDIIIDIEKSKDPQDCIAQPEEPRNVMLFEPVDVPIGEFKEYKEANSTTDDSCTSNTLKIERKKGGKLKINKKGRNGGSFCLKVKRRKFACKVRGIKRSIILKNCCKSMTKRKKLIYSRKSILKEKGKRSPATLKAICISSLNSKMFQEYLLADIETSALQGSSSDGKDEFIVEEPETCCIPKLSALCENALNEYYEKGVLVINIEDDVDSRLYFLECDINENVLESNGAEQVESVDYAEESSSTVPTDQDVMGDSQETIKDFNSIHHEEIIPDNFKLFESKKFLQYLQNKYVRNNSLKGYVTKRILSKYKKRGLRTDRHKTKPSDQRT